MRVWTGVLSFAIAVACMVGFYQMANDLKTSEAITRFDTKMTMAIQSWRSPGMDFFMKFMTYSGGIIGVTVLTTALFWGLRSVGRTDDANFTAALVIIGTILAGVLKHALKRVRPSGDLALIALPISSSFPSGHSMGSMCLALAAIEAAIVSPTMSIELKVASIIGCTVYAVLVGISRVYLGVHWPSDVIAAWLLGGAWIATATGLNRILNVGRVQLPLSK